MTSAQCLVILNAQAGTLLEGGVADPAGVVRQAFADAGHAAEVVMADASNIEEHIARAARSPDHDILVIGGGDGTIGNALALLAESGKTIGILPLGTMNLLGVDLAIPSDLAAAATTLAHARPARIDLATVNGKPFHTLCGLGFFARVARARQGTRLAIPFGRIIGVGWATLRTVLRSGRMRLTIEADGHRREADAYAVLVTNNSLGPDRRRHRLDDGRIELHLMHDAHLFGRLRIAFEVMSGRWRESAAIESISARTLTITTRRSRVWCSVDGELARQTTPLTFAVQPGALSVLMPTPPPSEAAPR